MSAFFYKIVSDIIVCSQRYNYVNSNYLIIHDGKVLLLLLCRHDIFAL